LAQVVQLCGSQCPTVHVGDHLEADVEKIHEQLYDVDDLSIEYPRLRRFDFPKRGT